MGGEPGGEARAVASRDGGRRDACRFVEDDHVAADPDCQVAIPQRVVDWSRRIDRHLVSGRDAGSLSAAASVHPCALHQASGGPPADTESRPEPGVETSAIRLGGDDERLRRAGQNLGLKAPHPISLTFPSNEVALAK
jgi:hypothetical protein